MLGSFPNPCLVAVQMQPAREESLRRIYNLFIYNAISVSIDLYMASEYDMTNKSINSTI
jgi:hypothetical protein